MNYVSLHGKTAGLRRRIAVGSYCGLVLQLSRDPVLHNDIGQSVFNLSFISIF